VLCWLALGLGLLGWTTDAAAVERQPPNIVLVVLDDVGYSDLGCYGSEIKTPQIDRLAERGLRFTRFDTKAICSPSRAALLTGIEPHALGMADLPSRATARPEHLERNSTSGVLPANIDMLPQALRRAGYATFAVGKWHLIPDWEDGTEGNNASFPLQRGFDAFYGFKKGWTDQYHPGLFRDNRATVPPGKDDYHLSEDLVDECIALVDAHQKRKPSAPFFLLLGMGVAHAPIQAPRAYIDRYAGVYEAGWDKLREDRFNRMQRMGLVPPGARLPPRESGDPSWDSLTDQQQRVYARFMATYAGFLEHGDAQIGRLLAHLEERDLTKNTLIVVLSDNGAASESKPGMFRHPYNGSSTIEEMDAHLDELGTDKTQALYQRPWAMLGSTPYRRYKLWPQLGGVRAPLIVVPPGGSSDPGAIRTQLVDTVDLAPTMAEFAGAQFAGEVGGCLVRSDHSLPRGLPDALRPVLLAARQPGDHVGLMAGSRDAPARHAFRGRPLGAVRSHDRPLRDGRRFGTTSRKATRADPTVVERSRQTPCAPPPRTLADCLARQRLRRRMVAI
jgi:arylsulfatase A-like enzyme